MESLEFVVFDGSPPHQISILDEKQFLIKLAFLLKLKTGTSTKLHPTNKEKSQIPSK